MEWLRIGRGEEGWSRPVVPRSLTVGYYSPTELAKGANSIDMILSKPKLNYISTQPQLNITLIKFDMKIMVYPHKLINVSSISAVTGLVLMKL